MLLDSVCCPTTISPVHITCARRHLVPLGNFTLQRHKGHLVGHPFRHGASTINRQSTQRGVCKQAYR